MPSKPVYLKAVFETLGGLADEAAGILIANGALGCAVQRGGRAGSRSRRPVKLEAYFAKLKPLELRAIRRTMRAAGMLTDSDRDISAQSIVDPGWATMWQQRFEPTPIGERYLVVPPWHRASENGRISIVVKPGQAFGTGHHPTTAGALMAIDELNARQKIARALDVGAGSGILAITMAMLGIPKIVAIDNDPVTLENARENAKLNRVTNRIAFSTTPVARVRTKFDLVVANILSSTLIAIAPEVKRIVAHNGHLILGGILAKEAAKVIDRYSPELRLTDKRIIRGWATLIFAKRGRAKRGRD
ncbi:MAG TPA: 50S ribosomal protein L11 methyltransferase [Candidatus Binataceae bacterium]|nr:50S ribosomal protein L11 methyltransferase [Candidatus Binataceae bacterium]